MAYVLDPDDLLLEVHCTNWRCFSGKDYHTQTTCTVCNGTSKVNTEFGAKVLEFIKKHLVIHPVSE